MITSKNNPQLKNVRALIDSAKARKEQGLFVVEGLRLATEAPEAMVEAVYVTEEVEKMQLPFVELMRSAGKCEVVSADAFKSISDTVNPQGILAVVKQLKYTSKEVVNFKNTSKNDYYTSKEVQNGTNKLFVLLDDVRDPGNLGTIIRTAEAAGVDGVFMSPGCVDIYNPKVTRSTMGSIFRVPFAVCDLKEVIEELKKQDVGVYAATLDGAVPYNTVEYGENSAFIIGNEANGISAEVAHAATRTVFIPMSGQVESLNAAISAAVLMFYRRR